MKIECLGDYMLLKEIKMPEKVSLIITSAVKRGILAAKVIAIGPGAHQPGSGFVKTQVEQGDTILFLEMMSNPVNLQGESYFVLREHQVIAKLNFEENDEMTQINDEIIVGNRLYFVPTQVKSDIMRLIEPYKFNAEPTTATEMKPVATVEPALETPPDEPTCAPDQPEAPIEVEDIPKDNPE
jgi:co-chaperonin GroES (HSP10)